MALNSFPQPASVLKTRRETRTVRFTGVSCCVDIRQIDSARSNVWFRRVSVSGFTAKIGGLPKPICRLCLWISPRFNRSRHIYAWEGLGSDVELTATTEADSKK